jgi:alpha-L-fucosidase
MAAGPFEPTWPSLSTYQTPDWFRNAKFGIWAHWGPQCEAGRRQVLNHPRSKTVAEGGVGDAQWQWGGGAAIPDKAYADKLYNRTVDLIDNYDPDLVYYDDTVLPLWPVSDIGPRLVAHMYNRSVAKHGKVDVVVTGKILDEVQRRSLVWDIERGQSSRIEPLPWQTCTCIGNWHYDRRVYDNKAYKSARTVVHTLIDVVSKNGNLLLSVPVRGNGSIDEQEQAIVEEIGRWNVVNGEGIFDSRPRRCRARASTRARASRSPLKTSASRPARMPCTRS